MNICIYGKKFDVLFADPVHSFFRELKYRGAKVRVHESFLNFLNSVMQLPCECTSFSGYEDIGTADLLISIGGDGTLLDCVRIVRDRRIPVIGINTGRLGFLSTINLNGIHTAIEAIFSGNYRLDKRSMIQVNSDHLDLGDCPYALNEVGILNRERSSMIRIHTHVNGAFMNTYWADGLIASTPTGSTAYSLSCGGPIVTPESDNLILTPIAAHNLTVRPVVLPNTHEITLRAEGRSPELLLSIDSANHQIGPEVVISLTKAPFDFHLIALEGQDFFQTIRTKMGWGLDKRN